MKLVGVVLAAAMLFWAGALAQAEEAAPPPAPPAAKIAVPVVVQPNEVRNYKLSVGIKGRVPVPGTEPADIEALYTMGLKQQFGVREGDGLLMMWLSAVDPKAVAGTEKISVPAGDFPKLTLLLDKSWKITNLFGISGTRYAGLVPGLNYGNLVLLFFIPDAGSARAIGESWSGKAKLPGVPSDVTVTTTLKSVGDTDGVKSVAVHQEYVWAEQQIADGKLASSKAAVDSTFALDTGKLLKSHTDCEITFTDPAKTKPEEKQYKAVSKIDIVLEKPAPAAH